MTSRFFIFAGESSGDLHGSHLMQALSAHFVGVGGPAMRAQGLECILKMEEFQVMGFSDVIKSLPKLWKHFRFVRDAILDLQPDGVILIDYPGFNLRLATQLRQKGFRGKIIQYICPSVWAHGKKRIDTMAKSLDLLLTILPFEPNYFTHTPLNVRYVGHPLMEIVNTYPYQNNWKAQLGIDESSSLLALFPGSRVGEVQRNLPLQLQAARLLQEKHPKVALGLSYSQEELLPLIQEMVKKSRIQNVHFVPKKLTYELMRDSHTAIAKSGTVTLELALHQRVSLVTYKLTQLNYWIAKHFLKVRLPHYCLVNILANQEVFPELIDKTISVHQLYDNLERLYNDENLRQRIALDCQNIKLQLGPQNAHAKAANAIRELLS